MAFQIFSGLFKALRLHILFLLPLLALASARPAEENAEQKKPKEESDSEQAPVGPSTPHIHPFPSPRFGQGTAPPVSFEPGTQGPQLRSPFQSPAFSSYPYGGVGGGLGGGAAGASQFQPQFSQYGANSQLGGSYAAQQPSGYGGASGGFGAGSFGGGGGPPAYNALGGGSYGQPGGGFGGGSGGFGGQRSGPGGYGGGGAQGGAGGQFPQQSFAGLPSNYNPQTVGYYGNGRIPSSYQGFGGGPNGNLAQRAGNGYGFVY